jgi:negative regulator of flagellin synthesis FlgM
MPPIDLTPIRAVRAADRHQHQPGARQTAGRTAATADKPQVQLDPALAAGLPPVNHERVNEIRKAIEDGRYPVTPMRVADAMIAAGFLWRAPK